MSDTRTPSVDQVWRSPFLNVFDRKIKKIEGSALYFDSDGATWGWISLDDWNRWVKSSRATVVQESTP
jgi:hypothetical protein